MTAIRVCHEFRTSDVRGDGIGEIALLYSVPRTATVTAASPAIVFPTNPQRDAASA